MYKLLGHGMVNKRVMTFANFGVKWFLWAVLDSCTVQGQVDTNVEGIDPSTQFNEARRGNYLRGKHSLVEQALSRRGLWHTPVMLRRMAT
jgi:hypothetical protein